MKLHELKLLDIYAKLKKDKIKLFEIRKNDRGFQVGDLVKYNIVEEYYDEENKKILQNCSDKELCEYFEDRVFKIKYITNYEQQNGYVVFSEDVYYIGEEKPLGLFGSIS